MIHRMIHCAIYKDDEQIRSHVDLCLPCIESLKKMRYTVVPYGCEPHGTCDRCGDPA